MIAVLCCFLFSISLLVQKSAPSSVSWKTKLMFGCLVSKIVWLWVYCLVMGSICLQRLLTRNLKGTWDFDGSLIFLLCWVWPTNIVGGLFWSKLKLHAFGLWSRFVLSISSWWFNLVYKLLAHNETDSSDKRPRKLQHFFFSFSAWPLPMIFVCKHKSFLVTR